MGCKDPIIKQPGGRWDLAQVYAMAGAAAWYHTTGGTC